MEDKSIKIGTNTGSPIVTGHVGGNVSSEVKDSFNTYTSQQRQNLAEAAAEIQQLLEQLSQTYPTITTAEKIAVVAEATDQIERNPKLKERVINALKAGGTEAFKEAINHPLVNILIAAIEGWKEA
jgi:hypothetical protein